MPSHKIVLFSHERICSLIREFSLSFESFILLEENFDLWREKRWNLMLHKLSWKAADNLALAKFGLAHVSFFFHFIFALTFGVIRFLFKQEKNTFFLIYKQIRNQFQVKIEQKYLVGQQIYNNLPEIIKDIWCLWQTIRSLQILGRLYYKASFYHLTLL